MSGGKEQAGQAVLAWRSKDQPGFTVIEFSGELNEHVDFTDLRARLNGPVVFHMGGIRRINSSGVREWVNFMQHLSAIADITLTHCSPVVVSQFNMIHRFCGNAHVISFYAPYSLIDDNYFCRSTTIRFAG